VRTSPLAITRWRISFMVVSTSTDFGEPEPARLL
jgi:hypothetical protein